MKTSLQKKSGKGTAYDGYRIGNKRLQWWAIDERLQHPLLASSKGASRAHAW